MSAGADSRKTNAREGFTRTFLLLSLGCAASGFFMGWQYLNFYENPATGGIANEPMVHYSEIFSRTECWKLLKSQNVIIRGSLFPISTCMREKVVSEAMVVSYDMIRGQKTPQRKPPSSNAILRCLHGFGRQEVQK